MKRDHFVYTAYDENGTPLYVGCTSQPEQRYRSHMRGQYLATPWFDPYVTKWQVSGPYPKAVAYRIEKERISALTPVFNGLPGNKSADEKIQAYIGRRPAPDLTDLRPGDRIHDGRSWREVERVTAKTVITKQLRRDWHSLDNRIHKNNIVARAA